MTDRNYVTVYLPKYIFKRVKKNTPRGQKIYGTILNGQIALELQKKRKK